MTEDERKHIDPVLLAKIESAKDGVDLETLPVGTTLQVQTLNTLYEFIKREDDKYNFSDGGKRGFPGAYVVIGGSTWGGSSLKRRWVGLDMHVEMSHPGYPDQLTKIFTTSPVQRITIIGPDGDWSYTLENE